MGQGSGLEGSMGQGSGLEGFRCIIQCPHICTVGLRLSDHVCSS